MKANYHTHTSRCHHAEGEDREYVENAIKGGYKVLGFSDHCPWVYRDGYVSGIRMLPGQLDDYFSSLTDLKAEYSSDIKIYIGFESEYIPELIEEQDKLLSGYPVDYMILGQHFYGHEGSSPYTGAPTYEEEILKRYVDSVIEGMETGRYKYAAHPDLINFRGESDVYKKHMKRLCRYMKEKDIPVEINLLGMITRRHYPSRRFFQIAQEVGNSAIIGCDTHIPEELSSEWYFKDGISFAKSYGLEIKETIKGLE